MVANFTITCKNENGSVSVFNGKEYSNNIDMLYRKAYQQLLKIKRLKIGSYDFILKGEVLLNSEKVATLKERM